MAYNTLWQIDEDDFLLSFVRRHGTHWAQLAPLMSQKFGTRRAYASVILKSHYRHLQRSRRLQNPTQSRRQSMNVRPREDRDAPRAEAVDVSENNAMIDLTIPETKNPNSRNMAGGESWSSAEAQYLLKLVDDVCERWPDVAKLMTTKFPDGRQYTEASCSMFYDLHKKKQAERQANQQPNQSETNAADASSWQPCNPDEILTMISDVEQHLARRDALLAGPPDKTPTGWRTLLRSLDGFRLSFEASEAAVAWSISEQPDSKRDWIEYQSNLAEHQLQTWDVFVRHEFYKDLRRNQHVPKVSLETLQGLLVPLTRQWLVAKSPLFGLGRRT